MKRIIGLVIALMMLCGISVFAADSNIKTNPAADKMSSKPKHHHHHRHHRHHHHRGKKMMMTNTTPDMKRNPAQ